MQSSFTSVPQNVASRVASRAGIQIQACIDLKNRGSTQIGRDGMGESQKSYRHPTA